MKLKQDVPHSDQTSGVIRLIEKAGKRIHDPVILFIWFLAFTFVLTALIGGLTFETSGAGGSPSLTSSKT